LASRSSGRPLGSDSRFLAFARNDNRLPKNNGSVSKGSESFENKHSLFQRL